VFASRDINGFNNLLPSTRDIPSNYKVLFLQGGGSGQFSAIALNLMNLRAGGQADYIVSGTWSDKGAKEAEKYGKVHRVIPRVEEYTGLYKFMLRVKLYEVWQYMYVYVSLHVSFKI
jgi:phosphoserine aminotransferase